MDIPSFEELFKQIKENLWLIGIPYDDFKFTFRFIVLNLCLTIMIICEILFIAFKIAVFRFENLLEITRLVPCLCIGLLSLLKVLAMATKRKNIYELTESLKQLYIEAERDEGKITLLRPNVTFLIRFIKYFFILNWVLISVYNFSSVIIILIRYLKYHEVVFILPYDVFLPFEVDGWFSWIAVYLFSIYCGFSCTLVFTTTDVLYYVLTSQICGNLKIIASKFNKLDVTGIELQEIVKDHQYILKLADDLEDIYTAPNLFNVLVGSIEICALGFNLTRGDSKEMLGYILFLISVLLQILMMSFFGENIITESLNIGQAAYASNWYNMDQKSKKTILTILIRSGKPQKLTAYKFSVIGYASFCKIINTSWTYFTILQTVTPTIE